MNISFAKVIRYILSIAAAAVMLYFSFREVDWNRFIEGLEHCNWWFIILAMAASIAAFWFRSQRWKCLLRPIDPTIDSLSTFNGVNIGYLANFVFPRLGEVVRCGFIARRSASRHKEDPSAAASFDKTFGTVLMSRSWDVLVVFILFAILLCARWQKFGGFFVHKMWNPFCARLGGGTYGLLVIIGAAALLCAVCMLVFRSRNSVAVKIGGFIKGIGDGFVSWGHMEGKWHFFIWTVLMWTMYWLMCMAVIWAMPQLDTLGAVDALFISLAGSFAWMVPVPGGFGAYHYFVALALSSVYALDWDTGMLCATLNHEAQAVTMIACGAISYFIELIRK